jgi:hypothetical protein
MHQCFLVGMTLKPVDDPLERIANVAGTFIHMVFILERRKRNGVPLALQRLWILVVSPPRLRPKA